MSWPETWASFRGRLGLVTLADLVLYYEADLCWFQWQTWTGFCGRPGLVFMATSFRLLSYAVIADHFINYFPVKAWFEHAFVFPGQERLLMSLLIEVLYKCRLWVVCFGRGFGSLSLCAVAGQKICGF